MGTETMKGSNYAWAIAIACVAFYAIPLGVVANQAGLFASPVMEEFGWSRTDATLYMSIQPWVAAICTPFAGKLISKFNPRWVMTAAAAVFGLASLACAWFTEPWQWNVYGVLYGASAAFWMYIATPTFINRWFAKSNGTVIGVIGVCASLLGAFMSPVIQGWISGYGWHTARIIISLIALIASVVLTAALLRESPEKMGVLPWGYGAAEVASAKSEAKSVIDVAADEGATAAQARKNPALWLLIVMAGFFVIAAGMMQQFSSYASTGALGAAVGATRVACDEGWIESSAQIGQTGLSIAPRLYIGLGVSGAVHHTSGIQGAGTIVAVCDDSEAPIFEMADYGVVGDVREVVPQLVEELARLRD